MDQIQRLKKLLAHGQLLEQKFMSVTKKLKELPEIWHLKFPKSKVVHYPLGMLRN